MAKFHFLQDVYPIRVALAWSPPQINISDTYFMIITRSVIAYPQP